MSNLRIHPISNEPEDTEHVIPLSQGELIMHHVRFRVLMALSGRELTTLQTAEALPDISRASVYRHVHALHEGGLIHITRELPNRATVKKVYAQSPGRETLKLEPERTRTVTCATSACSHSRSKTSSASTSKQLRARPMGDGVSHRDEVVYLTPEERDALVAEIQAAVSRYNRNQPAPKRVRFHIARILIPESPRSAPRTPADEPKGMDRP